MKAVLLCVFFSLILQGQGETEHTLWTQILQSHVTDKGEVNYKALQQHPEELEQYLNNLKENQPQDSWSENRQKAYWINVYNAYTIQLILNNYPVKSIKDIKNPWDKNFIPYEGSKIALNTVEHKILRKMNDPRIHFAIVCASESCPKLKNLAFEEATLDSQLDLATQEFLNDTSKNLISKNSLLLSKIFKWFRKDFEVNGSLIDFIDKYSKKDIDPKAKVKFKDYNWDLNE